MSNIAHYTRYEQRIKDRLYEIIGDPIRPDYDEEYLIDFHQADDLLRFLIEETRDAYELGLKNRKVKWSKAEAGKGSK